MRAIAALTVLMTLSAPCAFAQVVGEAGPNTKLFASADDIVALVAKAKADRKEGAPLTSEPILRLAPYRANLEYRTATAPAAVHETEAEMMYVLEGSGTVVTGGKLVNEKRNNEANLSGSAIEGGSSQTVNKGDVLIVPQNTPHQVIPSGPPIILMTLHVPRTAVAP